MMELEVIARRDRASRACGRDKRRQVEPGCVLALGLEHPLQRRPRARVVHQVITELAELVENHVLRRARQLVAGVVYLLDVALGANRAHDISGLGHPRRQPPKPLLAHALGQHGHTATPEHPRYRHTATTVIARRRPHRPVRHRIEVAGDQPGHQAAVGGQHLVRVDHRKPIAKRDQNRAGNTGERLGQRHVSRRAEQATALGVVVPVHAKQIERMG